MRLVDVTDIEKFIREKVCVIGDDHLLLVAADDGKWHEALPLIKTAYDVDKVVEELEEWSFEAKILVPHNNELGEYEEEVERKIIYTQNAIGIVKQGGVADDVCEWHKVKNGNAYKCNTHAEIHDSRVLDWCACPYCGKKIKVVE